jgi:hypothetical protein
MTLSPPDGVQKNYFQESCFGWAFETWAWNLIARADSIAGIMLAHLNWREDALVVTFPKHKADQTGDSIGKEKHVYANPYTPQICPMTSFAVFFFCQHPTSTKPVFAGDSVNRFGHMLRSLLVDPILIPQNVDLGALRHELGSHSNRKGSATFLCALSVSLNPIAIYLRAGWSVGSVQDRYIFAGAGGDQIVGRAVCGLNINSTEFGVLPPHFSDEGVQMLNDVGLENFIEGYMQFPATFKRVVPYLLASVVYHLGFLQLHLDKRHPLWFQRIFTKPVQTSSQYFCNLVEACKGYILTGNLRCEKSHMQATGLPSHFMLTKEFEKLSSQFTVLEEQFSNFVEKMSATVSTQSEQILTKIAEVPLELRRDLLEHFTIEGVAPVNMSDIKTLLAEHHNELFEQFSLFHSTAKNTCTAIEDTAPSTKPAACYSGFMEWEWGGQSGRMFPETFEFRTLDCKTMWNLWHFGHSGEHIRPFKTDGFYKHLRNQTQKVRYCQTKRIMLILEKIIQDNSWLPDPVEDISSLDVAQSDEIFERAFSRMMVDLYAESSFSSKRPHELMIRTLCNRSFNKRAKKSGVERRSVPSKPDAEQIEGDDVF